MQLAETNGILVDEDKKEERLSFIIIRKNSNNKYHYSTRRKNITLYRFIHTYVNCNDFVAIDHNRKLI